MSGFQIHPQNNPIYLPHIPVLTEHGLPLQILHVPRRPISSQVGITEISLLIHSRKAPILTPKQNQSRKGQEQKQCQKRAFPSRHRKQRPEQTPKRIQAHIACVCQNLLKDSSCIQRQQKQYPKPNYQLFSLR